MRTRSLLLLAFLVTVSPAWAQKAGDTYLGMYLNGSKIGWQSFRSEAVRLDGKPATKSESQVRMSAGLLGTAVKIEIDTTTWTSTSGKPLRMRYAMRSAGREQQVNATFGEKAVQVAIVNTGVKSQKELKLPSGAPVVDDPLQIVLSGGKARTFYILDPMTVSFVKNEVKVLGPGKTEIKGKPVSGNRIQVSDPRANTLVWFDSKGGLLRVDAPMGIVMLPVSRTEALSEPPAASPRVDLADATALRTDIPLEDPNSLTRLKLRFEGRDMSRVPSDTHQTVTGSGLNWTVEVHPLRLDEGKSATIAEAAKAKPEWTRPGLHIPSDDARFMKLSREIVGEQKEVRTAALRVRSWVHRNLRPNSGIGVLRDASDVLDTKEGVCRDYAILTATLTRAAGIPTRLASGLVNWDGTFYYHAWVEVWDGRRWLGIDSTGAPEQISAAHVKLADGTVEEAFTFTFLERVKVRVLEQKRD